MKKLVAWIAAAEIAAVHLYSFLHLVHLLFFRWCQ